MKKARKEHLRGKTRNLIKLKQELEWVYVSNKNYSDFW